MLSAASAFGAAKGKGGGGKGGGGGGSGDYTAPSTVEFGIRGFFDLDGTNNTAAYTDIRLGYFLFKGFELGITTLQGTTPDGQHDTEGIFSEYDWSNPTRFIPFAGGALKHAQALSSGDGQDGRIIGAYGGMNILLGADVALAVTLDLELANHRVLREEKTTSRDVNLGLRIFF